jgi:hypothetical protein
MSFYRGPNIVTNGLTLYVDGANSKSYPGEGTVWKDLSAMGNDLTFSDSPEYDNKTMIFSGNSNTASLSYVSSYGVNNTWEAWINRNKSINTYNMYMGKFLPYFSFRGDSNRIFFSINISGQKSVQTLSTYSNNTWLGVSFTTNYDSINELTELRIYVNGKLNMDPEFFSGSVGNNGYRFIVGDGQNPTLWYPFSGSISCIRVYNRTLSSEEILQNFNALRGRFGI